MKDDAKIQKLFEFLASNDWDTNVTQGFVGRFQTSYIVSIDDIEYKKREAQSVTVDFNTKTVTWYAASISGHNGDEYDRVSGTAPWSVVHDSYDVLYATAKNKAMKVAIKEEEAHAKRNLDALSALKLKEILGD